MGAQGATCFHTLAKDTRDLTLEQWDTVRFGQVCTDATNFASNKAALEKLCKETKNCNYEQVATFLGKVLSARSVH